MLFVSIGKTEKKHNEWPFSTFINTDLPDHFLAKSYPGTLFRERKQPSLMPFFGDGRMLDVGKF